MDRITDEAIDGIFRALADPSRRGLLDDLFNRNGQTLSELAAGKAMTRQAVAKHLAILESVNLVASVRRGREKLHYLNPVPIHEIGERWISKYDRGRLEALSALKKALEQGMSDNDGRIVPPDVVYVTYIKATPEKIWEALTSSAYSQKMFFGLKVESDWKHGSRWAFISPDGSVHDEGEVLESDPPRRLKLSWRVVFFEEARDLSPAFITYDIEPMGEATKLTMTQHQPKPIPRKFYEGGKQGWPYILSVLKSVLETGEGFTVQMGPPQ